MSNVPLEDRLAQMGRDLRQELSEGKELSGSFFCRMGKLFVEQLLGAEVNDALGRGSSPRFSPIDRMRRAVHVPGNSNIGAGHAAYNPTRIKLNCVHPFPAPILIFRTASRLHADCQPNFGSQYGSSYDPTDTGVGLRHLTGTSR